MCYSQFLAMAFALSSAAATAAEIPDAKPIEIPLKQIWAFNIAGTRDVRKLDPPRQREPRSEEEFIDASLVEQIVRSLNSSRRPKEGEDAGEAFVVVGTGVEALRRAQSVLAGKGERVESVPTGKDITLVFYKFCDGRSVLLDRVEYRGSAVNLEYHLNIREIASASYGHFALIPLGKLTAKKISVNIRRMADTGGTEFVRRRYSAAASHIVCASSHFEVVD